MRESLLATSPAVQLTGIRKNPSDWVGLGLAGAFACWVLLSAVVNGGNPWPIVGLAAATTTVYAAARKWGDRPVLVAGFVTLGILAAVIAASPGAWSGSPLAPVTGYANANAALYVLGAAAAAVVATFAWHVLIRLLAVLVALTMLVLTVISGSVAAVVLAGFVLLAALTAGWLGRWIALAAPTFVLAAITATVLLALSGGTSLLVPLEEGLTERRVVLWREAVELTAAHPLIGVGPGGFAEASPTALADADARWAHSAYLQLAAETGVFGVLLLLAVLIWVYVGLYRSQLDRRLVVIGTTGVTALAVHAAIDYVANFPSVIFIAAVLAGLATSRATRSAPGPPEPARSAD